MALLTPNPSTGRHASHRRRRPAKDSGWMGPLAVTAAAVGFGLNPFFATRAFAAGVSPLAASAIRIAALMIVLTPVAPRLRGWGREAGIVAAGGAASMLGFSGFFIALHRAPVAAATVVYYTYPVAVLVLSSVLWRQRLRTSEIVACLAVLAGVVVAVGPVGIDSALLIALAPAFAAPLGWAIYLLVLGGPAASMPTLPKVFAGSCGGTAAVLPLALWQSDGPLMPLSWPAVSSMALLVVCTLAVPAVLISWGAARAGGRSTAMIGSFEFVVAVAAGWLLLGDHLTATQVAGVTVVLLAAMSATRPSTA